MDEPRQSTSDPDVPPPTGPVLVRRIRESDLESIAVQLGTVAGNVVAAYRGARQILKEQGLRSDGDQSGDLTTRAKKRAEQRLRAAGARLAGWRRSAWGKTTYPGRQMQRSHQGAAHAEREYPLHIVLATGVVGVLLGAVLGVCKAHDR